MKLKVPFHRQETIYYCGPASLQMVFEFFGLKKSQEEIAKETRTTEKRGTPHKNMIHVVLRNRFYCYVNKDSTLHEVKHFIDLGIPVIVNYLETSRDEMHYAIITDYEKDYLILNDPWNGKNLKLTDNFFRARWFDYHKHHIYEQGIIVISPEKLGLGKQFSPKNRKKK